MVAAIMARLWSDIKSQDDMGLLLVFMFLWNMVGAIIMIPALACLLLPAKRKAAGTVLEPA